MSSRARTSTSATAWTRNLLGIAGGLAGTIDQTGTVTLDLANMHGDIVATCPDDTSATGVSSYSESTEYGAPRDATTAPDTYGWLGTKRRSTNDLAGLTLMGVRLYNPTTGRFLSVDPVPGGNENPYVYVDNPTDQFDLDGNCWRWRWCHRIWHAAYVATNMRGDGHAFRWAYRHVNVSGGACPYYCFSGGFQHGHFYRSSGQRGLSTWGYNIGLNGGYSTSRSIGGGAGAGFGAYGSVGTHGSWRNRLRNGEIGISIRPGGIWGGPGRNHTMFSF